MNRRPVWTLLARPPRASWLEYTVGQGRGLRQNRLGKNSTACCHNRGYIKSAMYFWCTDFAKGADESTAFNEAQKAVSYLQKISSGVTAEGPHCCCRLWRVPHFATQFAGVAGGSACQIFCCAFPQRNLLQLACVKAFCQRLLPEQSSVLQKPASSTSTTVATSATTATGSTNANNNMRIKPSKEC